MKKQRFVEVIVHCDDDQRELALAALDNTGFDSAMETDEGLSAYFDESVFDEDSVREALQSYGVSPSISWSILEDKNWNEEWEKNFDPVVVDDLCLIRAPFHNIKGDFPFEIIIQPKMSFGTGHHNTTYLMVKNQIKNINHKEKKVLDCGCGTAILAIAAEKLGARMVIGNDVDEWSIENAPENLQLNNCQGIEILHGSIEALNLSPDFDIVLANINKNILLDQMKSYADLLISNGLLLISGFYENDLEVLNKEAVSVGLQKVMHETRETWACALYKKSTSI